ncbi:hypothetical protein TIFTF001_028903 [Ficus carica]|uniref:Uncharacterized protein n=1 Tax=Ficus carica TaxID=3494 RepID=A0AA88DQT5_FICCA|nr:hypothetical protein TIFTF001_028903 [Ficus carica]
MLKSVMALMSKWKDRVLARNNCPYLNRRADALFINGPLGLGCSGDSIGLNSECSRRVDMLQASAGTSRHSPNEQAVDIGDGTGAATGGVSSVRWRLLSVGPGHRHQLIRGGYTTDIDSVANLGKSTRSPGKNLTWSARVRSGVLGQRKGI